MSEIAKHWIDGEWVGSSTVSESINPATGAVLPGQWFSTYAEPAGVVGIIVPWNSPVALLIRSLAPALSAGNTVAVKMPGQTALVANLVSQIIAEVTSLPRGVVTSSPNPATRALPTWSPHPTSRSSATPAAPQSGASSPRTAPPPSSG